MTYDIRYRVYGSNEWRTFATGVDASQPFEFSLPQPGNLYYTHIGFFFGDVPANFGLNNQIRVYFVVGADAPNNLLVNRFVVSYTNGEREGSGTANVVTDPPTDGDSTPNDHVTPDSGISNDPTENHNNIDQDHAYLPDEYLPLAEASDDLSNVDGTEPEQRRRRINPQTGDVDISIMIILFLSISGIIATVGAVLYKKHIKDK